MESTRRQIEKALREVGYSRSMAKQICDSGLPGYFESLSDDEKRELGLLETKSKYIDSLLERAEKFLQ